jgi:hypothetical protein
MSIRVHGRVEGGRLRVDTPVDLPDNTEVELIVDQTETETEDERELREAIAQSDAELAALPDNVRAERSSPTPASRRVVA